MIQATSTNVFPPHADHWGTALGGTHEKTSSRPALVCDDILTGAIAMLSDQDVEAMTRSDLLDAVRAARTVPHFPIEAERIADQDDHHLRRVLYAVRRWMRTRCNEQSRSKGWTPYFRDRF